MVASEDICQCLLIAKSNIESNQVTTAAFRLDGRLPNYHFPATTSFVDARGDDASAIIRDLVFIVGIGVEFQSLLLYSRSGLCSIWPLYLNSMNSSSAFSGS